MKYKVLLVAILVAALVCDASAELKRRKVKKKKPATEQQPSATASSVSSSSAQMTSQEASQEVLPPEMIWLEQTEHSEKAADARAEESLLMAQRERMESSAQKFIMGTIENNEQNEVGIDLCSQMIIHCSAGEVCEVNENGEPVCNCIKQCPFEPEERRQVCTNLNETFNSDCEVHRERCICKKKDAKCKGPEYEHVQVEYYGTCREMPECLAEQLSDFPRRMRDWLFYIMRDLADRHELSEHYMVLEKESESNLTRGWINAAVWKWCDLDADDNDRFVSRHELFPIKAPLMALEHCISPFLNSCDKDDDHRITLSEWGKCLELDESEITDRCEVISEDNRL